MRCCGADLNGDKMRIYRAYLRISDYCSVTVMVRIRIRTGVADCCIQIAGESDKMQIKHVNKSDQWRSAPLRIFSCPTVDSGV